MYVFAEVRSDDVRVIVVLFAFPFCPAQFPTSRSVKVESDKLHLLISVECRAPSAATFVHTALPPGKFECWRLNDLEESEQSRRQSAMGCLELYNPARSTSRNRYRQVPTDWYHSFCFSSILQICQLISRSGQLTKRFVELPVCELQSVWNTLLQCEQLIP